MFTVLFPSDHKSFGQKTSCDILWGHFWAYHTCECLWYEYQSRAESWRDVQPKTQEQFARMIYKINIYIYIELGCIICSKTYQKYLHSCSIRYIQARNAWPLSTPSGSHTAVEKIAHHWQPHALRAKANHEWWQQSDVSNFSDLTRREGWRRATKKGKSEEKSRVRFSGQTVHDV